MMRRLAILLVATAASGCATSPQSQPLTTPATFGQGLQRINRMLAEGRYEETKAYVERHKESDPVVYWAFQVHLDECLWDSARFTGKPDSLTLRTYEEFLKAYEYKYLKREESNKPDARDGL